MPHKTKYFKPSFVLILMIMTYSSWKPQVCQKNWIFHESIQKMIFNTEMPSFWIVCLCTYICIQYLFGPLFALLAASMRHGMEAISLLHCWGVIEAQVTLIVAFSSSALFGLLFLIFLWTKPHRLSMGFRSGKFAGQSSTLIPWLLNQLLVLFAVWAGC